MTEGVHNFMASKEQRLRNVAELADFLHFPSQFLAHGMVLPAFQVGLLPIFNSLHKHTHRYIWR